MLRPFSVFFRRLFRRWNAVLALVFAAALAAEMFALHLFDTTEHRLGDLYMVRHADEYHADPDIVIVDIDDYSMQAMKDAAGLWPWPREIHADLLEGVQEFGPRAVVFDITFTEPDIRRPKSDARFSEVLAGLSNVYLPATWLQNTRDAGAYSVDKFPLRELAPAFGVATPGAANASASLQLPHAVSRSAWQLGLINRADDHDGVLRRYRLRTDVNNWQLPSVPARVAKDLGATLPQGKEFTMRWPAQPHMHVPYSELYKALYERGPDATPEERQKLRDTVQGKVLIIGVSTASAFDHHRTPLAADYPGVDVLAVALDNLKNARAVQPVPMLVPLVFGWLLLGGIAYYFSRRTNPLSIGALLIVTTLVALFAADNAIRSDVLVPLATPLIFAWVFFLVAAVAGFLRERHSRRQAVALFGRFLNPNVVRQIVDQGETVEGLSGQARNITVLFADIRGFTTMSETKPAQEVVNLLNRHFNRQVDVVFRHGGTLDKFIGDCIMAFWGAPLDDPDHAKHAVAAAVDMQDALLAFKRELEEEGSDVADFDIGIGVHSGPAVIGFIGALKKLEYTAIGDTVNLASRVEGLTKGVARVLVTRGTMEACQPSEDFIFEHKGAFAVKGRAATVELYEPKRKNQE